MRRTAFMFLLCLAAALLNTFLNLTCLVTGLPLYMDTVLTVAVTFASGPFWGSLTGTLTNLIGHSARFWGWEGYLFALCSIASACITYLFVRLFPRELSLASGPEGSRDTAGMNVLGRYGSSSRLSRIMDRLVILIFLSFGLCAAMSVLGGLITAFIHVLRNSAEANPASAALSSTMFRRELPPILTEVLSRIPINIIDRLISAFGGYGIALAGVSLRKTPRKTKIA